MTSDTPSAGDAGTDLEFRRGAVDTGDGAVLVRAMAAEMARLYDGLVLDSPDLPAAGPRELGPPYGGFWVGYRGPDPVCCGGFKRLGDGACEIKRMYVAESAREQGVARRLLAHLEREAWTLGYTVARLDTGPKQPYAQRLYQSAGYLPIDNFNGHPVATYFGEKQLAAPPD